MNAVPQLARMVKYVVAFLVLYGILVCVGSDPGSTAAERRAAVERSLFLSGIVTLGVFAVRTWQKVKHPAPPAAYPSPPPSHAPR